MIKCCNCGGNSLTKLPRPKVNINTEILYYTISGTCLGLGIAFLLSSWPILGLFLFGIALYANVIYGHKLKLLEEAKYQWDIKPEFVCDDCKTIQR